MGPRAAEISHFAEMLGIDVFLSFPHHPPRLALRRLQERTNSSWRTTLDPPIREISTPWRTIITPTSHRRQWSWALLSVRDPPLPFRRRAHEPAPVISGQRPTQTRIIFPYIPRRLLRSKHLHTDMPTTSTPSLPARNQPGRLSSIINSGRMHALASLKLAPSLA